MKREEKVTEFYGLNYRKEKEKFKDDIRERLFYVYKWYGVRTTVYWKDNVYKIVSVINNKKR